MNKDSEVMSMLKDMSTTEKIEYESNPVTLSRIQEKRALKEEIKEKDAQAKRAVLEAKKMERKQKYEASQKSKSIRKSLRGRADSTLKELQEIKIERRAKEATDIIKYNAVFADGICQVDEHKRSVMLHISDISYRDIPESSQEIVHEEISRIYDSASDDIIIQRLIVNTPSPDSEETTESSDRNFYNVSRLVTKVDIEDALEYNRIINEKMREGVSNIERGLYFILTIRTDDLSQATHKLADIRSTVQEKLSALKSRVRVLSGEERLKVFHSLLRPFRTFNFSYERSITESASSTTKDYISPYAFIWNPDGADDIFKVDDVYGRVLALKIPDGELNDRVYADIASLPIPLAISDFAYPIDRAESVLEHKKHLASIDSEIIKGEKKAFKHGHNYYPGTETTRTKDALEEGLRQIQDAGQRMFGWCGYVYTYAKTAEELNNQTHQIIAAAKQNSIEAEPLALRQHLALNSVLPIGQNLLPISRVLTTAQVAMPSLFVAAELFHKNGVWGGQNRVTNNLVLIDTNNRDYFPSGMIFICGPTGTGKSMTTKNFVRGLTLVDPTAQVIYFDRKSEYRALVEHVGGTVIKPAISAKVYFNPLELSDVKVQRGGSLEEQIGFKADAIIAQAAASAEAGGRILSEEERSILSRCVENIYAPQRRHFAKHGTLEGSTSPLLQDLYNELGKQKEQAAKSLQLRYERFVTGNFNFFNNPSNADWSARQICIDLSATPTDATIFSMIATCEAIRNLMYYNASQGIKTIVVLEELQALTEFPSVLEYFSRLINEGRQFGLKIVGITQIPDAILAHEKARNLILNSDCIILLKQSMESRLMWEKYLGLGKEELLSIGDGTKRGDGLIVAAGLGVRVPFKGEFPETSYLYDLFQTEPENEQYKFKSAEEIAEEIASKDKEIAENDFSAAVVTQEVTNVDATTQVPTVEATDNEVPCILCKKPLASEAKFCHLCGANQEMLTKAQDASQEPVAGVKPEATIPSSESTPEAVAASQASSLPAEVQTATTEVTEEPMVAEETADKPKGLFGKLFYPSKPKTELAEAPAEVPVAEVTAQAAHVEAVEEVPSAETAKAPVVPELNTTTSPTEVIAEAGNEAVETSSVQVIPIPESAPAPAETPSIKECKNCKVELAVDSPFCPQCGTSQNEAPSALVEVVEAPSEIAETPASFGETTKSALPSKEETLALIESQGSAAVETSQVQVVPTPETAPASVVEPTPVAPESLPKPNQEIAENLAEETSGLAALQEAGIPLPKGLI